MAWRELEYPRSQVINAGKVIRDSKSSEQEIQHSIQIIDNWRAAHAYPMHVMYIHLRRMASMNPEIVVAERLKRLDSIIAKLKREPTMNLWTMQDLGGCRVILPKLQQVFDYATQLENSRVRHVHKSTSDYIASPRVSGYRSLHYVFQFHSDKKSTYNDKMLVEIQFRTRLQHLWATAVETLGLSTNQALKAGQGDADTQRFFALVSSLFAIEEDTPIVPNTPANVKSIIEELCSLNQKHNYIKMLRAIRTAADRIIQIKPNSNRDMGYCILIIDFEANNLRIHYFKTKEFQDAVNEYNRLEGLRNKSKTDAVLVRVSSINALKIAYPNYFSDIGDFVKKVGSYLV